MSRSETLGKLLFLAMCKIWLLSISAFVRYHGKKPKLSEPQIFVANHTSFTDFFLMSSHLFPHATVAQVHGGLFGFLQRHALHLNGSLFFYRDESKDREKLARKMREHTQNWKRSPLIIFPEGTCVNNEYTVLFHKGAFELGCAICPVAIKYNKRLLDPYWNTREQTFTQHMLYLMTRWFMIADVWWLPAAHILPSETSIEFANRVKSQISKAAGLKDLSWNGYMKNYVRVQDQERLQQSTQLKYGTNLKQRIKERRNLRAEEEILSKSLDTKSPLVDDNLFEPRFESTLTDLKNEILLNTPPSNNYSAPLRVKVSGQKERLVRSWKHHSVLNQLPLDDEVKIEEMQRVSGEEKEQDDDLLDTVHTGIDE